MNSDSDEIDLLLAEVHIARNLARKPLDVEMPTVSHADIWAAIRRPSDQPVSLAFARSLRDDPKVAQRYRQMLKAAACGFSPVAMAASDGVVTRRIGTATLRLFACNSHRRAAFGAGKRGRDQRGGIGWRRQQHLAPRPARRR